MKISTPSGRFHTKSEAVAKALRDRIGPPPLTHLLDQGLGAPSRRSPHYQSFSREGDIASIAPRSYGTVGGDTRAGRHSFVVVYTGADLAGRRPPSTSVVWPCRCWRRSGRAREWLPPSATPNDLPWEFSRLRIFNTTRRTGAAAASFRVAPGAIGSFEIKYREPGTRFRLLVWAAGRLRAEICWFQSANRNRRAVYQQRRARIYSLVTGHTRYLRGGPGLRCRLRASWP
jgi:hypothetical protein